MAPRTSRALAIFCAALFGACGVTLTAPDDTTPEAPDGAAVESGADGTTVQVDGGRDADAPDDGSTDARDAECEAATTTGCACGTVCASMTCSDGGCDPLVFVTLGTFDGNLGVTTVSALAFADSQCQSIAATLVPAPTTTFKAWLGAATMRVDTRFIQSKRPYRLANAGHSIVATSFAALNADLMRAIDVTHDGSMLLSPFEVWTGTDRSGAPTKSDCSGWTAATMSTNGSYGLTNATTTVWTRNSDSGSCGVQRHLYCFEQLP